MKKQRSFDTLVELKLRRLLYHAGLRYRVHSEVVPGTRRRVDLAFVSARVAVFLDGCFWHGCSQHRTIPVANRDWWTAKIDENRARDRDTDERLRAAGWEVIRVWEHEDLYSAGNRIERLVTARKPPRREPRKGAIPDSVRHGTLSTYGNWACRCSACRAANARYQQELLARYRSDGGRGQHGTDYRYRTGCRCDQCRAAHAAADREYRRSKRKVQ